MHLVKKDYLIICMTKNKHIITMKATFSLFNSSTEIIINQYISTLSFYIYFLNNFTTLQKIFNRIFPPSPNLSSLKGCCFFPCFSMVSPSFSPSPFTNRVFPKIGVPQNGWFIMENPIKDGMIWGYHYFWKHPTSTHHQLRSQGHILAFQGDSYTPRCKVRTPGSDRGRKRVMGDGIQGISASHRWLVEGITRW